MISPIGQKYVIKLALLLMATVGFVGSCMQQANKIDVTLTSVETPAPIPVKASDSTFKEFSHSIPEHKEFECISCHRREGKSRELDFAGHESCVGCHMGQFIDNSVTDQNRAMCSICHASLDSKEPAMKPFPVKFKEGFNMKFDHAVHNRGEGRPPNGCAACHSPAGAAQTIPSGIATHNNCYTCHTPESKVASCSVCHELAPYRRTLPSQYNFKAIFRHSDHTARQGVSCDECHTVVAGPGQGRQVRNISVLQHRAAPGADCLSCHNGRRAFTGNDPFAVSTCTRCHTGSIGVLPSDTVQE
mgnify:CR=1 FL=1